MLHDKTNLSFILCEDMGLTKTPVTPTHTQYQVVSAMMKQHLEIH